MSPPGIYTDVIPAEQEPAASSNGAVVASEGQPKAPADPMTGMGPLLEEQDDKKVFKAIHAEVQAQEKLAKNRFELAKHLGRIRRGIPFSTLTKNEDKATWKAELPPGVTDSPQPIPNKADDLCAKIVSQVLTDPFKPEPKPEDESNDKQKGAADLLKRFLVNDGLEGGTSDGELFHDCLDTAMTRPSFVHVWVDMEGDGWRPRQVKAHPEAVDANNPLVGPDGMPTTDYILRYVTAQAQFTENPAEADRQWLPKLRRDVLTDANVRTVPATEAIGPASAVILLMVEPLSNAKRRFPALRDMKDEELKSLADWRPLRPKALIPEAFQASFKSQETSDGEKGLSSGTLIFWYQKYCVSGYEYPDGADIAVSGANDGTVLNKATLRDDVEGDDTVQPIVRDVPVSMCKPLHDTIGRDPLGSRPIMRFGAANEARSHILGAVLEDVDQRLHPNTFLPVTSPVQAWQMNARDGTPIPILSKDDIPAQEEFADLPAFLPEILNIIDTGMETAAGLGDTAQSLESPNAISGVAKQVVVGQTKVNLAPVHQNFGAFVTRYWRIKAQLAQCKLTVPQQVQYAGIDSAYKQRWFTGADFIGVKDITIQAGTGTMMAPVEKQQYIGYAQSAMWLDPEEAAEVGRGTLSDDLGLGDNPHAELTSRELAEWSEGPPEGWMPSAPAVDPMSGQPMMDPMTGQPAMQPPSWNPFEPRPTDEDPSVAKAQYKKLRDFIATSDYSKQPPEWKALVDARYAQAAYAAGVQTVKQQYEAQAQQAATQQQQAEDQSGAEKESKDADREGAAQESAAGREAAAGESAANRESQMQQTVVKSQAQLAASQARSSTTK